MRKLFVVYPLLVGLMVLGVLSTDSFSQNDQRAADKSCDSANRAEFKMFDEYKIENGRFVQWVADIVVLRDGRICVRKEKGKGFELLPQLFGSDGTFKLYLRATIAGLDKVLEGIKWYIFDQINENIMAIGNNTISSMRLQESVDMTRYSVAVWGTRTMNWTAYTPRKTEEKQVQIKVETEDLGAVEFDYRLNDDRPRDHQAIHLSLNGDRLVRTFWSDKTWALTPGEYIVIGTDKYDSTSFTVRAGGLTDVTIREKK